MPRGLSQRKPRGFGKLLGAPNSILSFAGRLEGDFQIEAKRIRRLFGVCIARPCNNTRIRSRSCGGYRGLGRRNLRSCLIKVRTEIQGHNRQTLQIERLRRFNEKFSPTWRPRYIYYEAPISLPRVLLAYLEAEELLRIPLVGARARLKTRLRRRSLRKALA